MNHQPVLEILRGGIVESTHCGSVAVSDGRGGKIAWWGDPDGYVFLRSAAKPMQVLPLLESGAASRFGFDLEEIALMCASHSGTDAHAALAAGILRKIAAQTEHLQCGTHVPFDRETAERLRGIEGEPTPLRHNCSGKHAGMLALGRFLNDQPDQYLDPDQAVQGRILNAVASMCGMEAGGVGLGVDGCSAPNFAVPLHAAAMAYARLADPDGLAEPRASACGTIWQAMTAHPQVVGGPGRFDTRVMEAVPGRLLSKGGAEGYQAFALPAGSLGDASPALGVALKIGDGDLGRRAAALVSLEVLRQLGALQPAALDALRDLLPPQPVSNHRGAQVGEMRCAFRLEGWG